METYKVQFEIEVNQTMDKSTVIGIKNVSFEPNEINPMLAAFATMQFLQYLTRITPPEYLLQEAKARKLFDQIAHFAKYLELEDFMKPLADPK